MKNYEYKYLDIFTKLEEKELSKERLEELKDIYIDEETPMGSVKLAYDHTQEAFIYYSERNISYKYLETVGRHYICNTDSKSIFINYAQELIASREKNKEIKEKILLESSKAKTTSSVFATFKKQLLPMDNKKMTIIPEKANKYIYMGKISHLKLEEEKKTRLEELEKLYKPISFSEYKNFKID